MRKKIARTTARNLPWYLRLFAALIGASVPVARSTRRKLLRHRRQGS